MDQQTDLEPQEEALTDPNAEQAELAEEPLSDGLPRLIVKRNGAETEDIFPIYPPTVIGRFDPEVGPIDIDLGPLPEGVYVSRKHAEITETDGVFSIRDLGSSNGTFVKGDAGFERSEEFVLTDGLEFTLGNARFIFRH